MAQICQGRGQALYFGRRTLDQLLAKCPRGRDQRKSRCDGKCCAPTSHHGPHSAAPQQFDVHGVVVGVQVSFDALTLTT